MEVVFYDIEVLRVFISYLNFEYRVCYYVLLTVIAIVNKVKYPIISNIIDA